jgi:acyl dehydratase
MKDLTGITKALKNSLDVACPLTDEQLQIVLEQITQTRTAVPSETDVEMFGMVTLDNNPAHRDREIARSLGFEDIPVMGAHTAAYGEQYGRSILAVLGSDGNKVVLRGQENRFKAPFYLGDRLQWRLTGFKETDRGLDLNLEGMVNDKKIIATKLKLGRTFPEVLEIPDPTIYTKDFSLDLPWLKEFYACVGRKSEAEVEPPKRIPSMLYASYVPSTLLELLKEVTGKREGTNLAMNFEFLQERKLDGVETVYVDISQPRQPTEHKGTFHYKFKALVREGNTPITYGEIRSTTPHEIDFSKLSNQLAT